MNDDGMPPLWRDDDVDPDDVYAAMAEPVRTTDEMPPERPTASNPAHRTPPPEDPVATAVRAAEFAESEGQPTEDEPTVRTEAVTRDEADAALRAIGWLKIVPNSPYDPADMYALMDPALPTIDEASAWIDRARAAIDEHERAGGTAALRRKITERVDRVELQCERWLSMVAELRQREKRYYPPHVAEARDLAMRQTDDDDDHRPTRARRNDDPTPFVAYASK